MLICLIKFTKACDSSLTTYDFCGMFICYAANIVKHIGILHSHRQLHDLH